MAGFQKEKKMAKLNIQALFKPLLTLLANIQLVKVYQWLISD
jgi:hypothetical protein